MILLSQVKNDQSIFGLAPHEEDYDAEREDKSLHLYQSFHRYAGGRLLAGCAENTDVFDFEITAEDMRTINDMPYFGGSGLHPDEVNF